MFAFAKDIRTMQTTAQRRNTAHGCTLTYPCAEERA